LGFQNADQRLIDAGVIKVLIGATVVEVGALMVIIAILRPFENPKKQSDGGGRLNPSRFLFRLAFLSWSLVPVRRIALFLQDS
jgi:hypothetical protein